MPTINSKEIINKLIENDGFWPQDEGDDGTPDPRVVKIVEYTNIAGKQTWGVIYIGHDLDNYRATEYVRNPVTIWEAK